MRVLRRSSSWTIVWIIVFAVVGVGGCKRSSQAGPDASSDAVEESLAAGRGKTSPAADRQHPIVRIDTSEGAIVVKLDKRKSLLTVNNFVQYVNARHYDGTIFHAASPGVAIIGGLYMPDMAPKPTRPPVRNEARGGRSNTKGTIAMARDPDRIDSATSSFVVNLRDNTEADYRDDTPAGYGYCVFGEVIEGMDVAERIGAVATHEVPSKEGPPFTGVPVKPVVIRSARVVR